MLPSYVEKIAQIVFGADADAARPYIRGFLSEREEARGLLSAESSDNQWQAACVNWAIRQFVIMERRVADAHQRVDTAYADRDGYRARIDKVDAVMEQLLHRFGLVANLDGEGRLVIEPAPYVTALNPAATITPIKKKRGGWPKGKKRAPDRKAAAKVKTAKKARRKAK